MNINKMLMAATGLLAAMGAWALPADGLQGKHQGVSTYFRNIRVREGARG